MRTLKSIQIIQNNPQQFLDIKDIIENEGAVILRNIITVVQAEELKNALLLVLKEDDKNFGDNYIFKGMVHALMNRGKVFIDLIENKELLGIFRAILGHGCIIHAYNSSSMPPNHTNFSRSIHVDCPRLVPNYITNMGITIALDDFTSENGAMEITPHLFNQSVAPDVTTFDKEKVVLDNLKIGDAILFNARCWHRGGINKTDKWRHAVTMNICRAYMRQQFDFPAMMHDKTNQLSENAKQFIGFNVRMPKNMEQFLLPADKRLYKPGQE